MLLYVFLSVFAFAILLQVIYCKNGFVSLGKIKISFSILCSCVLLLILFILTAFRNKNIGNDTNYYLIFYNYTVSNISTPANFEIGYRIYCYFLGNYLLFNGHYFLILTAVICYIPLFVVFFKKSQSPEISIVLFFCMLFSAYTNTLRQCIAMSLILIGYCFLKDKKTLLFILFVLLASCFHLSALLCILLLFSRFFPKRAAVVILVGIIFAGLSAFNSQISGFLSKILPSYSQYFSSEYAGTGWLGLTYYILRNSIFYVIAFIGTKGITDKSKKNLVLTSFALLLLLNCLGFSVNLFSRASEYFLLICIVELPRLLIHNKYKRTLTLAICIVSLLYFIFVLYYKPEWNHLIPYQFWGS